MAFGQQAGPPATQRQVRDLLTLLQDAGHTDFRDARGPMGFTQRQAAGKFTRDEADSFITQLEEAQETQDSGSSDTPSASPSPSAAPRLAPSLKVTAAEQMLRRLPAEQLAAELQRRGWVVMEP